MRQLALLSGRGSATLLSVVIVVLVYAAVLGTALAPAGFNPLVFARIGRDYRAEQFWDQSPLVEEGAGYDGQFFYYIARDPLLRHADAASFDVLHYRYQRILLPVL